jgi:hypothetical protein
MGSVLVPFEGFLGAKEKFASLHLPAISLEQAQEGAINAAVRAPLDTSPH